MWMFSKDGDKGKTQGVKLTPQELKIEAEGALQKALELYANPNWTKTGDKPCNTYNMKVEDRTIIKGDTVIKATLKQI